LYYFNTNDGQGEIDVSKMFTVQDTEEPAVDTDEMCESCTI
jgi:hypothetical protein